MIYDHRQCCLVMPLALLHTPVMKTTLTDNNTMTAEANDHAKDQTTFAALLPGGVLLHSPRHALHSRFAQRGGGDSMVVREYPASVH